MAVGKHQERKSEGQQTQIKPSSHGQGSFFIVVLIALVITLIFLVNLLNILNIIPISWTKALPIEFAMLSIIFVFLQLCISIFPKSVSLFQFVRLHLQPSHRTNFRRIIGIPPSTDLQNIQQCDELVENLYAKLIEPTTTAIVLTGSDGVGKSTLASLVCNHSEKQRRENKDLFKAEPIWLSITTDTTIIDIIGTLLEVFNITFHNLKIMALQDLIKMLFNALKLEDKARIIVLDQFDNFLIWQTGYVLANRSGINELIDAINRESCQCRFLLTSYLRPQGTYMYSQTYLLDYHIKGLKIDEGVKLLEKWNLQATKKELIEIVELCNGHPLSLVQLASFLHRDRNLNIALLLANSNYNQFWLGNITINSLNHIYSQLLSAPEQKIVLIFSVFREAVPLSAIDYLLELFSDLPMKPPLQKAVDTLLTQKLLQVSNENCYQLDTVLLNYIHEHLILSNKILENTLQSLHEKAAQYYQRESELRCVPSEKRRHIRDLHPLIEAVWHLCQAKQWQEAYELMEQEDIFTDLRRWGGITILLELYQLFLPFHKLHFTSLQLARLHNNLGKIYDNLGKKKQAQKYYEEALTISREVKNREEESRTLNNLSGVYSVLGEKKQARNYLRHALDLTRKSGDREGEGITLNNLGRIYSVLGKKDKASSSLEQALSIFKEVGDHRGEGRALNNLGLVYGDIGQKEDALQSLKQALSIMQELGDRWGEGRILNNIGRVYEDLGQKKNALSYYEASLLIRREVKDYGGEATTLNNIGRIHLDLGKREEALQELEQALSIFEEVSDRWGRGRTLNNLGRFYNQIGKRELAQKYFEQALSIFREVRDRRGKARVFNSLALLFDEDHKEKALAFLLNALRICREIKDRQGEGWTLHNLGRVYNMLMRKELAQKYFVQALQVRKDIGDSKGEGWALQNIGTLYFEQRQYDVALACFVIAERIFHEIESTDISVVQRGIKNLRNEVGNDQFGALLASIKPQADWIVEKALSEKQN